MRKIFVFVMLVFSACGAPVSQTPPSGDNPVAATVSPTATQSAALDGVTPSALEERVAETFGVIEIKENLFVAQTNDIYLNPEFYMGKTIKYEGLFSRSTWSENDVTYYSVIRYGPGCCGTDGNCGFEVIWDKDYPEEDDWVEVVGVLGEYEEDGYKYLRLTLESLTVLSVRGAEYVTQ